MNYALPKTLLDLGCSLQGLQIPPNNIYLIALQQTTGNNIDFKKAESHTQLS